MARPFILGRALGCDQATIGSVLWIPPLGWEIGYFFWGWTVDRAVRARPDDPRTFRRLFAGLAALSLPLAAAARTRSLAAVLALLFAGMFVAAGFVIVSLAETTRRHSEDHGAYLAGIGAGSWSLLMTIIMPFFGRLFDRGAFSTAYAIAAGAPAVGWVAWRILSRLDVPRPA